MTDDAADDDDERLKSLRAVWLSMPDEDPPERGLADLMAAARTKAHEMATQAAPTTSLWHRFLELLRRPPVLALATVTVLLGGAALVGRRSDKMESSPSVAQTRTTPESMTAGAPPAAPALERADNSAVPTQNSAATGTAAQGSSTTISPEAERAPGAGEGGIDSEPTKGVVGGAGEGRKSTLKHGAESKQAAKQPLQTKASVDEKEPARRAPPADDPIEQRTESFDDGDLAKDAAPKKTRGATPPPKEESKLGAATAPQPEAPPEPTAKQLHQLARAAAARGDCSRVEALLKKLAAVDPDYFRKNAQRDTAFLICERPE